MFDLLMNLVCHIVMQCVVSQADRVAVRAAVGGEVSAVAGTAHNWRPFSTGEQGLIM